MIGGQHVSIGQRTADAEKNTGDRQKSDGQHKRLTDTLQKTEEVFFHKKSFRDGGSGNSVFSLIQGNRQNFLPTCL